MSSIAPRLATALLLSTSSWAHAALELVTAQEAAQPPSEVRMRGLIRAPGVRLAEPGEQEVTAPFRLKIEFEQRNGQKIDPKSVELIYVRAKPVSLTKRIDKSISATGIEVPEASAPAGEHAFIVKVRDVAGRLTEMPFSITVKP